MLRTPQPIALLSTRIAAGAIVLAGLLTAADASAQAPAGGAVRPFLVQGAWSTRSLRWEVDPAALESAPGHAVVRVRDVVVPTAAGFETIELDLEPFHFLRRDLRVLVDGQLVGGREVLADGFSAWTGRVVGEADSDVFLALTPTGALGWIERADGGVHVVPVPQDGDWTRSSTVAMHVTDPLLEGAAEPWRCGLDTFGVPTEPADGAGGSDPRGAHGATPEPQGTILRTTIARECRIAVETDFQYFQRFAGAGSGQLTAAMNYATALLGAVSIRYRESTNTTLTASQMAFYTNSNDPWTTQETGGGSGGLLDEFSTAWRGANYPPNSDLAHFISGASLGGGVAFLSGLCSRFTGFGVSGNIAGNTPIPVQDFHPLNWDFMVVAHEIGHNFSSPHTHDYCPPIDTCASGACSGGGGCGSGPGTIMSYCHLCSGGMTNIRTHFHDRVATRMNNYAENSCIPLFDCEACGCGCPVVTSTTPSSVVAYDPLAPRTVTLHGSGFLSASLLLVDDVPVEEFTVQDDATLVFDMPLLQRTGSIPIAIGNSAGLGGGGGTIQVDPVPAPLLHIDFFDPDYPLILRQDGLPLAWASDPGDLVFVFLSSHDTPSFLPGIVSLDIGAQFTDLVRFWTVAVGPAGYVERHFATGSLPTFRPYWLQGVVMNAGLPLEPSPATMFHLIF